LTLLDQFQAWLESTYNDPEFAQNLHCFRTRKGVELPSGETVDYVSVRHERGAAPDAASVFSVGLWKFDPTPIDGEGISAICRQVEAFRAWYGEALERAEMAGLGERDRVGLHGNLVGSSVRPSPLIDVLSAGTGAVSLWTYRRGVNRIEVEPFYGSSSPRRKDAQAFRELFEHLPWQRMDGARPGRARKARVSAAPAL
jgi:hypothetical protein